MGVALEEVRTNWDALGRDNPLWAIRSDRADWDVDDFFAAGRKEIDEVFAELGGLGVHPRGVALDFGCGAGRLTQALAARFDTVVGVDVARSMVALAEEHNRQGDRCRFVLNEAADLACFADGSFDFLYSNIVLQHVGTELAKGYIAEFLRVVAPGGILVFQVPSHLVPVEPLPPEDCRARIDVQGPGWSGTRFLEAGTPVPLRLTVENRGASPWSEGQHVRLGFRWFAAGTDGGTQLVDSGQRVRLASTVVPGGSLTVECELDVPHRSGEFSLAIDVLQEEVTWFEDQGSEPLRLAVVVSPAAGDADAGSSAGATGEVDDPADEPVADAPLIPRMMMRPVPREEVLAVAERHGGEIVAMVADAAAGPHWVSYHYVVRRRADPIARPVDSARGGAAAAGSAARR